MMRVLVLASILLVMLGDAPIPAAVEPSADPRPRVRLAAGTTIQVIGTRIVCVIAAEGKRINCTRFTRRNGKVIFAQGEHEIVLRSNGHVLVNRVRGKEYEFVFGRFPAAVARRAPIYYLLPDKEFWVPGSRIVCQVAVTRKPLIASIQCGFADRRGRIPTPNTYGASLSQTGVAGVVRFNGARKPVVVFNSKTNAGKKTVKLPLNGTLVFGVTSSGLGLACMGVVLGGSKAINCFRGSTAGKLANDYEFYVVEDGSAAVAHRTPDGLMPVFLVEGTGLRGGSTELPTNGETFFAENGDYFKLAGTQVVCRASGSSTSSSLACGIAARNDYKPLTHSVSIRFDGSVTVTRYARNGAGTVVYRSPPP